jgi:hypothetical protein
VVPFQGIILKPSIGLRGPQGEAGATGAAGSIQNSFTYIESGTAISSGGLLGFGYAMRMSPDQLYLAVGARLSDVVVIYNRPSIADEWAVQQQVTGSDTVSGDRFGAAVNFSGDAALLVVGAPDKASDQAYVFQRTGTVWSQQATLTPVIPVTGVGFGKYIDISYDGNTIRLGGSLEARQWYYTQTTPGMWTRSTISEGNTRYAAFAFPKSDQSQYCAGGAYVSDTTIRYTQRILPGTFANQVDNSYNWQQLTTGSLIPCMVTGDSRISAWRAIDSSINTPAISKIYLDYFVEPDPALNWATILPPDPLSLADYTNFGFDLALSDDGTLLAATNNQYTYIYQNAPGTNEYPLVTSIHGPDTSAENGAMAMSPSGDTLMVAYPGAGTILTYTKQVTATSNAYANRLQCNSLLVETTAISTDTTLTIADNAGQCIFADAASGTLTVTLPTGGSSLPSTSFRIVRSGTGGTLVVDAGSTVINMRTVAGTQSSSATVSSAAPGTIGDCIARASNGLQWFTTEPSSGFS